MNNGIRPHAAGNPSVIFIGADGFIGRTAASALSGFGWNVIPTVFQRPPTPNEIHLDVTRPVDFEALPPGVPVVNAAGLPDQSASPRLMRRVHVGGMRHLRDWARRTGCPHVIQLSSVSVYGNATVGTGRTEASTRRRGVNPLAAALPYGRTKARGEAILESSGLPWTALRLPAVYGPGDSFLTRELHRLLVESNRSLPPAGNGIVSLMPVDEAPGLVDAVLRHGPLNAARNAAAVHVPWRWILETYAEAWDVPLRTARRGRLRDYLDFAQPGIQMAAYYGARGAEFPDRLLRREIGWEPAGDWRKTARNAAMYHQESAQERSVGDSIRKDRR